MKKILYTLLIIVSLFTITGCFNKNGKEFKKDYEKLNGTTNKVGKEHRSVSIPEDNPFVEVSADEIVKKIDNKETFYVYFGSTLCPWCRSVIESAIKVAKNNNIKTIYYVDIWDDEGKEILRDKYEVVDGKATRTQEGTDSYYKLLNAFDSKLRNYTVTKDDKEYDTKEKRIYAPNYFYIKDGKVEKLVTGKSDKLTDSRAELTNEIKEDQEKIFNDFFRN